MEPEQLKFEIQTLLKNAIQEQLARTYPSKTYSGVPKPVSGGYTNVPKPKNLTRVLSNSVNVKFESDLDDGIVYLVVDFGSADYWYIVDMGRKPGQRFIKTKAKKDGSTYSYPSFTKFPPLSTIRQWVQQRPALTGNLSIDARTYLAARSIAEFGIGGINFIDNAIKETEIQLLDRLGDYALAYLNQILENKLVLQSTNKEGKLRQIQR